MAMPSQQGYLQSMSTNRARLEKPLPHILIGTGVTTAMVVGIIAVAGTLGWLLAYLDFNDTVLGLIKGISGRLTVALLSLLGDAC